jgi:hypothetical protein
MDSRWLSGARAYVRLVEAHIGERSLFDLFRQLAYIYVSNLCSLLVAHS